MEIKAPSKKKELQSLLGKINFLMRIISNLSGRLREFSPLLFLKKKELVWHLEHQKAFNKIKEFLPNPPILSLLVRIKYMKLYIYASYLTIGSVLA